MNLNSLRNQIDDIDRQIVLLIAERISLVKKISRLKKEKGLSIKDPVREHKVYLNVETTAQKNFLDKKVIKGLFAKILDYSKNLQK